MEARPGDERGQAQDGGGGGPPMKYSPILEYWRGPQVETLPDPIS